MNMNSKQLQFELWQECNSQCKFCYLGKDNLYTPNEIKLNSLHNAYDMISKNDTFNNYDTLSYLGGEFFQGQLNTKEIKTAFYDLMKKSAELFNNGTIKNFWIYATLTVGDQTELYDIINMFDHTREGFWILTSYDVYGRYHTQKMFNNWDYHMKNIHKLYPNIYFNTTSILSGQFIEEYLDNKINLNEFSEKYHTSFFFKQPGTGNMTKEDFNKKVPGFLPKRSQFLKFLAKFKNQEHEMLWDKLFNIQYRADMLYRNFNDSDRQMLPYKRLKKQKQEEIASAEQIGDCGHVISYRCYIDSDKCCLCDKHAIDSIS